VWKRKPNATLSHLVADALEDYFDKLDGDDPSELYDFVISEVEKPLLESTLDYCGGNQSKTAQVLGISRATLRKKLAIYKID
jgi:Fis family transcriptional regulator